MKKVVSFLLQYLQIDTDLVSFYFVTQAAICRLHHRFFDDPSPTDCITLPLDPLERDSQTYHILGEAFICPKTAITYAKQRHLDPYDELYRYLIHCLLHFKGYTDTTQAERTRMKKKENLCLKKLLFFVKIQLKNSN